MARFALRRLVALLGLLAVALFLAPGTALAHAVLQSSEPRSGSVVETAPPWVRVQFNEPVEAVFTPLMVYDRAGNRVDKGDAQIDPGDSSAIIVGLRSLPEGFYTVSYRVTSADGHPVEGAYGFSVGTKVAEGEPLIPKQTTELLQVVGVVHGVAAWGVVLLAGLPLFLSFIWRPVFPEGGKGLTAIMGALAGGIVLVGLAEVGLYAVRASGESFSLGLLVQALFRTRVGLLWLLRMALSLVVGLVLPGVAGWLGESRALAAVNGLVSGGLLLTLSLSSHAAAEGGALPIVADWIHLVAAALWAGGILGFVLVLPGAAREPLPNAVRRFSILATGAILLLAVTGLYSMLLHVDAWSELVKTDWGLSLLTKLALLIPLLLLGLINMRRAGRRPFRHLAVGELVLVSVLFVAVGFLTSVPPAKVAALPQGPYVQNQTVDGLQVSLRIEPFLFGYNDAQIQITGPDGAPVAGANVGLRLTMLEHEMGKQDPDAQEEAPGRYRAPDLLLGMDGRWRIEVVILTAAGQETRVPFDLFVPKQL